MVLCPNCRTDVASPSKMWSVLEDPDKKGGMVERRVGIYECSRCDTKFPHVFGKQKFKIVKADEWTKLGKGLADAQEKQAKLQEGVNELMLERDRLLNEIKALREKLVITELQARAETLHVEVTGLRKGKQELEEEIENYQMRLEAPKL